MTAEPFVTSNCIDIGGCEGLCRLAFGTHALISHQEVFMIGLSVNGMI